MIALLSFKAVNLLYLIIGGSIGTTLRYFTGQLAGQMYVGIWPVGTLAVNLIGSFIIGLLWGMLDIDNLNTGIKNLVFVGILGSFTTYSTYSLDILNLIRIGEVKVGVLYFLVSNVLGLGLVALGFYLGLRLKNG